jgi:hypothetical protein
MNAYVEITFVCWLVIICKITIFSYYNLKYLLNNSRVVYETIQPC